ncbi:hypothetical protein [Tepidibacter thalassicus]|uniref:Uncharacterized protein n=1 Tax=Tepidibacter thalassicus DSM 15285 TaxID=1123350 RepID=A0A1M5NMI3_9FIRM|nr:hypothetical protein [Tepidibacter thalassicus]SHG90761.1 hypothetical protein SAMN02744040_00122 [Tepidibacter thalassicus DSM 15285]
MKALRITDLKKLKEEKAKENVGLIAAYEAIAGLNEQIMVLQEELNTLKRGESDA